MMSYFELRDGGCVCRAWRGEFTMKDSKVGGRCRALANGLVGASALILGMSLSCAKSEAPGAPGGPGPTGDDGGTAGPIVIGVTLPLTGDLASLGKAQSQATQVAEA